MAAFDPSFPSQEASLLIRYLMGDRSASLLELFRAGHRLLGWLAEERLRGPVTEADTQSLTVTLTHMEAAKVIEEMQAEATLALPPEAAASEALPPATLPVTQPVARPRDWLLPLAGVLLDLARQWLAGRQ